jgi:hypothetical protein
MKRKRSEDEDLMHIEAKVDKVILTMKLAPPKRKDNVLESMEAKHFHLNNTLICRVQDGPRRGAQVPHRSAAEKRVRAEDEVVATEGLLRQGDGSLVSVRDWLEQERSSGRSPGRRWPSK